MAFVPRFFDPPPQSYYLFGPRGQAGVDLMAGRATVTHPKFYLFDTGVYRSLRPTGLLDRPEEAGGPALEGLVAQHLRAWAAYSKNRYELYYWRTRGGSEVDFVVYGTELFYAPEVKNAERVHRADLKGLKAFRAATLADGGTLPIGPDEPSDAFERESIREWRTGSKDPFGEHDSARKGAVRHHGRETEG